MSLEEKVSKEETIKQLHEWKKDLTPEERENILSIINQLKDDSSRLIAKKFLLENERNKL